jgi:hypothetical protein
VEATLFEKLASGYPVSRLLPPLNSGLTPGKTDLNSLLSSGLMRWLGSLLLEGMGLSC